MTPQEEPPRDEIKTIDKQRLDQISRFLQPTIPRGEEEHYRLLRPLVSRELSLGNIFREDMIGHLVFQRGIQEFLLYGQEDFARTMITSFLGEFKMTMSIEGKMLEALTKSKLEYAQTYTVHEHQHQEPMPKKGLFRR